MRSIGIDVGSHGIKIVEITTTNKGFLVTHAIERQFALKAHQDHEIEVLEKLKELTDGYDDNTRVVICVPQEKTIIRYRNFPFRDRIKIFKALAFELDEDLPYSSDDAVFDAKIIKTIGNTADVLACAVKESHIEKIYETYQSIGCKPDLLTAEGLAFANIFENWNLPPPAFPAPDLSLEQLSPEHKKLKIVLSIGYSKTLVMAYHQDQVIGVNTIFWGGKNLIDSIAKKYELPFHEAKRETELKAFILPSKNNASFDAKIFSDTIAKSFRELIRDLQLALLEIKTEHSGEIQEVFLTGGLSHVKGLSPFMTQALDVPVNLVGIFDRFPQITFDKTAVAEERFGLALGLAIEGMKKPRNPALQFLRGDLIKQNLALQKFLDFWSPTLIFAGVMVVSLILYSSLKATFSESMNVAAEENLVEMAKSAAQIPARQSNPSGITKYIKETKQRASSIRVLKAYLQMNSAMDVLKKITEAVPGKQSITLDVSTVMINGSNVVVEGHVASPLEKAKLLSELKKLSLDGKVQESDPLVPTKTDQVGFRVSFKTDRNIQKSRE